MSKVHLVAAQAPAVKPKSRTISGLILPYNKPGYTSGGTVTVASGVVNFPDDLKRVKLLRDHSTDTGFKPVGYAEKLEETPEGIRATFRIAATPDGDEALADVREGVRDALSVELVHTDVDSGGNLTAGTLSAVALVPIPAFADARVDLITASQYVEDSEPHEEDTTADGESQDEEVVKSDESPTESEEVDEDDIIEEEVEHMDTQEKQAAKAPVGELAASSKALTLTAAINDIASLRRGEASITAALDDITYSANPAAHAPHWLGQLWNGLTYVREVVPTMTQATLTDLRATGWRWKDRPRVDDYAGDKTNIPTNTPSTEAVEVVAKRLAAGWDIDRAYYDFGHTEFIQSFLEAAREDYAQKTDERAAQAIVGFASESTLKPTTQPDLLHAAAHARQLIKNNARVEPSAFLVHPDTMFGLLDINMLQVPQYLDLLGVDPSKFVSTPHVPRNIVIGYAKPAVTFYELAGSPIRVNAQHIAQGGIDEALFGYYATILNEPRGIVRVNVKAPAATE